MKNPFTFETQGQRFPLPFWAGQNEYEATACGPFIPPSVENPGGGRIKNKKIPTGSDLVVIQGAFGKTRLHRLAAEALKALVCAARADGIKHPQLLPTGGRSGFRDPQQQAAAWKRALERYKSEKVANRWVAKPGFSAHQSGRAIDFYLGLANGSGNVAKLIQTPAYKWMKVNANRFGFYPYPAEPWHWEYNPPTMGESAVFPEREYEILPETGRKCKTDWCSPDYIQWVQKSFNRIAKAGKKLREDGFLDQYTRGAISGFQKLHGLEPDGIVGPKTEQAIVSTGATQPPTQRQLSCSPTKTETLISKLNQYKGNIPLHILLGWIEIESGRQIGSITSLCERGYFQFTPEDAIDYGIKNHQLLSYDEDHSIQSGIKLVNHFITRTLTLVKKYGLPSQGEVFWKVVKLHHWIPSGPEKILADMQEHGVKPSSWAVITSYALDPRNEDRLKQKIKRPPKQGIYNADEMLKQANIWLNRLEANKSQSRDGEINRKSVEYAKWIQQSLNSIMGLRLAVDGDIRIRTRNAISGFQQKQGLKDDGIVGARTEAALIAASGTRPPTSTTPPSVGGGTSSPVNTPLPREGVGFYSHSQTSRQYGLPETIRALQTIGAKWFAAYPKGPSIGIGEISLKGGGDIKPHASHKKGVDVDIWLMRKDHRREPTNYRNPAAYSLALTQELVNLIRANTVLKVERIYFNDPQVQGVRPWRGHDDHLHVRFCAPGDSSCIRASQNESEFGLNEWETTNGYELNAYSKDYLPAIAGEASSSAGNRNSPAYIRWVQSSLNKILGLRLAVDGDARTQTRYAIRSFQQRAGLDDDGKVGPQTERALIAAGASPPTSGATVSSGSNNAPMSATPTLLEREKAAHGETLYLNIGLGMGKNLASTGIYIPNSFRPDSEIVIVLYLHGWKGDYPGNAVLINGYWDGARFPFFALREEVNASGQNVIFVAPSLGPKSEAGSLRQPGGFDAFMKQVLSGLNEHYLMPRYGSRTRDVQSIILSAHSGGGSPMLGMATGRDQYAMKIKECWCYDSMYGPVAQDWLRWAKSHPQQRLYVYSGPAKGVYDATTGKQRVLPRDNAEAIARQRLANVCVLPSRAKSVGKASAHFWVPIVHLKERLLNSPCVT